MKQFFNTLFVIALFAFTVYKLVVNHKEAVATPYWPTVEGRVTKTWINETTTTDDTRDHDQKRQWNNHETNYEPHVRYIYEVNGHHYESDRIKVTNPSYSTQTSAQSAIEKYGVGRPVTVHYNPKDPTSSVLEPG